jgi:hypothetical protein
LYNIFDIITKYMSFELKILEGNKIPNSLLEIPQPPKKN